MRTAFPASALRIHSKKFALASPTDKLVSIFALLFFSMAISAQNIKNQLRRPAGEPASAGTFGFSRGIAPGPFPDPISTSTNRRKSMPAKTKSAPPDSSGGALLFHAIGSRLPIRLSEHHSANASRIRPMASSTRSKSLKALIRIYACPHRPKPPPGVTTTPVFWSRRSKNSQESRPAPSTQM